MTIDFNQAIVSHVIWSVRLKCFLDGGECIPVEQIVSPQECDLGRWLYAEGVAKYGTMPQMQELEKVHAELHAAIRKVVQLKISGNSQAAELELSKLKQVSNRVVELILDVEKKLEAVNS